MKQLITCYSILCILLALAGCKADLEQVAQDNIIKLEVTTDTTNLKADGLALIKLKATIPGDALDDYRNITFQASPGAGSFQSSATASTNIIKVDNQGIATATFKVSTAPGTYYFAAQTGTGAKLYKTPDIPFVLRPLSFTDKLTLRADNMQPLADNQTLVTLMVTSDFVTDKTIKLTTNLGSFVASSTPTQYSLPLDDNGNGTTQLMVTNQVLPHIINASFADNTSASITLNPVPSRPDTLVAEPSSAKVDTAGAATTITVYLLKTNTNARVSVNTPATYAAYQLTGTIRKTVGRFTGLQTAFSDPNGKVAPVNFYADTKDIDATQPVYIDVTSTKTITLKFLVK